MVRKPGRVRAAAGSTAGEHRGPNRRVVGRRFGAIAVGAVAALTLSACGGGGSDSSAPAEPSEPAQTEASEPDPNAIQRALIGLHIEGAEGGAWASAPFGSLRLWDNGTGWSQIETSQGDYKWDNLEGALENAESKGLTDIVYVLGTTPDWATTEIGESDYPQPGAASNPDNIEDWEAWVTEVVTRYGDRLNAYQIWNEANLEMFYNGTPQQMAELTKSAYDIIKANDPDALVVAPSVSTRLTGSFDRFFPEYLAEMQRLGWPVDVWAVHSYPDGQGDAADRAILLQKFTDALETADAPELPIWDTEVNYGIAGPGDIEGQEITGADAAGQIVRTYIDDLRFGVERSYWYIWSLAPLEFLGVQTLPGSDGEQGFFALDNWIIGASFGGCTEEGSVVSCEFSKDGQSSVIAWSDTGDSPFTAPEGTQLVCDPLANCQEVAGGDDVTLTGVPLRFYLV
jgi:hypothetical protein